VKDLLAQVIFDFFEKHCDFNKNKPILLGLSGGPDSLALLYLLLQYKNCRHLDLGLAHVDHGWRVESGEEALQLERLAQELKLPFYLKKLCPQDLKGNLEAASREERHKFFRTLCQDHDYQAVVLGHHADDQAETVLKRLLEGSSLPYLSGLQKVTQIQELKIWRPLLEVRKEEILLWLKKQSLEAFEDCTNLDPRFLRGKFRTSILPGLSKEFGKEIAPSLCRIGSEALELKGYLDQVLAPYLSFIEKGKFGTLLDLSQSCPTSPFEIKHLVRRFCELENFSLSCSFLEIACDLILSGKANRQLIMGENKIYIDRKRLFIVGRDSEVLPAGLPLEYGIFWYGNWRVTVREAGHGGIPSDWREVLKGQARVVLPLKNYILGPVCLQEAYPRTSTVDKWWTDSKVPAFLRQRIPVLWEGPVIQHEFLTGKTKHGAIVEESGLEIILERETLLAP